MKCPNSQNKCPTGLVYHIPNPSNPDLIDGYIGVVNDNRGILRRFDEHCLSWRLGQLIKDNNICKNDVNIIYRCAINECYKIENMLRPQQHLGWNLASGGGGPYNSMIPNLREHRSKIQIERMKNEDLRKQQGEAFKQRYYNDERLQKIRS